MQNSEYTVLMEMKKICEEIGKYVQDEMRTQIEQYQILQDLSCKIKMIDDKY